MTALRGPGFATTLRLLLGAAAVRARARYRQQSALRRARRGRTGAGWGVAGLALVIAALLAVHLFVAALMITTSDAAIAFETVPVARPPGLPLHVSAEFLSGLQAAEEPSGHPITSTDLRFLRPTVGVEATRIARERGGNSDRIMDELRETALTRGSSGFTAAPPPMPQPRPHHLADLALTLIGALWLLMLVGSGEDATFDGQIRRHPMWEWLFSHPAPPAAIFLAESLTPIAANPLVFAAPLLPAVLFGWAHGVAAGLLALFVVGVPVMMAAACAGKAVEFAIMLRCSPRTSGAALAIKHWLGIASMAALFITLNFGADDAVRRLAALAPSWRPVPVLGALLGLHEDGRRTMLAAMLTCAGLSAVVIVLSVLFTVWSARRGLVAPPAVARVRAGRPGGGFRRWPLLRKELLWLARDRSAIVQIVLLPLSLAGFNLFQLGHAATSMSVDWHGLCGGGIVLGTLFLTYLGPRALASDGAALWIALSWPRGLEQVLRVKAALWTALTAIMMLSVFGFAAWRTPADAWKIALLVPPTLLFAWSMALKATTLASVVSESGEPEPVPNSRRWATQLGAFSFATGVTSGKWPAAAVGLVYSIIAGAAMWESFRARLPFLLDRWSERLPPPPTLTHALVAIGIFADVAVMLATIGRIALGASGFVLAYAVGSALVAVGTAVFLFNLDVRFNAIRRWPRDAVRAVWRLGPGLLAGSLAGAGLGGLALLYVSALPYAAPSAPRSMMIAFAVIAVFVAPFTEEFLFRGLLYRALDRQWGGWRALAGSAALFAAYHPMLGWPPVGALGLLNAWLFRRTGRLETSVAAHMAYNLVVVAVPLLVME